jgi:hypothetical protein
MTNLLLPVDAAPVAVVRAGRQFLLVAAATIAEGTRLSEIDGAECARPDQWSIQVGPATHIVVPPAVDLEAQLDRYPWRFMNHSCEPNTRIERRRVWAIRTIAPGEELTFNYNTTEWDMAVPFECRCGSARCGGVIQGFRHLSPGARARLLPLLSDHLRDA